MKVRLPTSREEERRREALRPAVEARRRDAMEKAALDYDTALLWSVRSRLGWGRKRLSRFYTLILDNHKELHGDFGAAKYRVMRKRLEECGYTVDDMLEKCHKAASDAAAHVRCKPKSCDLLDRLCNESVNAVLRGMSDDFEVLLIYVLRFDFGVSKPRTQSILNDSARMIAAYDVGSDRSWFTDKRDRLMAVGINVMTMQDTSEECIKEEKRMEAMTC